MSTETLDTSSSKSTGAASADPQGGQSHLRRDLSNRHIQLIAIGGAIGTGLFMGSGKTIHTAGPSIVVAYLVIGIMLFFVMRAMGEVLLYNLEYKSFQDFAADLLGPWAGFFLGWTYWLCWIATGMADLIGVTSYWEYWVGSKGLAVVLAVGTLLLLLGLNLLTVKLFGELEFWFALIKLIAISVLIIASILLVVIGFHAPDGTKASITNLWAHGGFMPSGWSGLFAGFQIAVFAFVGIELVGTTAAETKDPVKTLPKAINAVPVRVLLFYVLALLGIMSVTPWDKVHADSSPFVQMFGLIGFGAAATVMNFVVLTSAASGANSGIYSNSRMLFGLAHKGMAPKTFGKLSRTGVPTWGLVFTVILVGCSVILTLSSSIMAAFTLVTTVASVLFIFVWSMIVISYLRYRHLHPEAHATSVYPMPGGRVMCWVVLAFFVFVLALLTQEPDTLAAMELTPVWFIILGAVWAVVRRRARTDDSSTEAVQPGK
ncbi:D-serine/D-alanine/glycine transporter [Acidipropionibacterium acidipropionici ATCC 4875]|uniref:D-serine/D-alanine/glycine transporter n=1 Tax=Acidipropionibacterium acidipropionici (strain ATCC 4875 / DSM 20272 / JCM 6432 / NBRC 12425 / NCIMB 8070 / 4) TaxID=1171373 RepID=K7RUP6_ACIA4|nr:D-serine/D-alanine/glycine transporter [Acidipropionibacterium acidipropionici ATCC 4875]